MTRSAAEIASGLLPARPARPLTPGERIHVIGAAGAGASAAALLAHRAGANVSGCDAGGGTPYSSALEARSIPLEWHHAARHVDGSDDQRPDRIAVTKALTAVEPDHPELRAAARLDIPAEPWQQVIADVASTTGQRLVGVAGTHGKSTTSGWLVHLLVTAGRDPSAFVGALLDRELIGDVPATSRWGHGDLFVVEADEYAGNFDPYRPDVVLLLNAEWDHPDVFADDDDVLNAFERWIRASAQNGRAPMLVANVGDPGVARLVRRFGDWPTKILTVALAGEGVEALPSLTGHLRRDADGHSILRLSRPPEADLELRLGLAGVHNAANALVVCGAAGLLGVADDALIQSMAHFRGVGRRLELKGDVAGVVVLDDYGHHPTAIARTLEAVRHRYPGRRVWAVYEPLTFHRTAEMLDRFAAVLATADAVAVADIWAGRDRDTTVTSSARLAEAVTALGHRAAIASGSVEATADHLFDQVQTGDVVLVMGGGRSYVIADRLVRLLREQEAGRGPR